MGGEKKGKEKKEEAASGWTIYVRCSWAIGGGGPGGDWGNWGDGQEGGVEIGCPGDGSTNSSTTVSRVWGIREGDRGGEGKGKFLPRLAMSDVRRV